MSNEKTAHGDTPASSSHENHQSASGPGQGTPSAAKRVNLRRVPPLRCAPRRLRERRGVLLLVVLSVLVLFVLLTITYVIVATKERSAAKASARLELSGDPPNQLCDSLMMVLLRDTADIHSPFRSWSLLEGIYGNVNFRGQVVAGQIGPINSTGGQFFFLPINPAKISGYNKAKDYYKGCVATMVTGQCAGASTRIVASDQNGITVMRFRTDAGIDAANNKYLDPQPNDYFLVNGPAYSGMGRGYDPTFDPANVGPGRSAAPCGYPFVDQANNTSWPYALLPNSAYFQSTPNPTNGMLPYLDPAGMAGANVDYTAYDYNNMYLGLVTNGAAGLPPVLPSFHRADLCAYWAAQMQASGGMTAALARKILFRPTTFDHPIFNATTNSNFDPTRFDSPLDVDNMGTGIPDSIWIDPGLPVMTSKDGRSYKVLIAPLILDMDGRVNVNAHGSYAQLDQTAYPPTNSSSMNVGSAAIASAGGAPALLVPGEGVGPADVNLNMMFSQQEIQKLLYGDLPPPYGVVGTNQNGFQGRHGGWPSSTASRSLAALKFFSGPSNDYRDGNTLTAYGSPIDLKGRRYMALDHRGLPLYLTLGGGDPNDSFAPDANLYWQYEVFGDGKQYPDSPYGLNLLAPRPGRAIPANAYLDNPFTVAELERVMRPNDIDNRSLAPRLAAHLQNTIQSYAARNMLPPITTDSWDVPVPSLAVPRDYRKTFADAKQTRAFQITDLVRAKLKSIPVLANPTVMDREISRILPPEMLAGLKMDINRPFGNGRDDDGNGLVDESGETGRQPEQMNARINGQDSVPFWPGSYPKPITLNTAAGPDANDPLLNNTVIPAGWKPRQLMARYLYAMMMLFTDQGYVSWIDPKEQLPAGGAQELTARRVAQWAINAVCFRDSTSAMTPFVYHSKIFQPTYAGWTVDGDPNASAQGQSGIADRRVVWGCKPPDLVLTETLAFHDRRTADTTTDDDHKSKTDDNDPKKKDPNFDQIRVPQGSLFVELYCCRNPNNPIYPSDLYTKNKKDGRWYLDLSRSTRDTHDNPVPVWRMVITETNHTGNAPNADVNAQINLHPDSFSPHSEDDDQVTNNFLMHLNVLDNSITAKVDRIVWLGGQQPKNTPNSGNVFYNRTGPTYVAPSQYAVVGPRDTTAIGAKAPTPYGQPSSQKIVVRLTNVMITNTANDPQSANIKQPVGVIAAAEAPPDWNKIPQHKPMGIGLNVSEPLPQSGNYYPEPMETNKANQNFVDAYGDLAGSAAKPFLDAPLEGTVGDNVDPKAANRPLVKDGVQKTGTYEKYKYVFLQRLADPSLPFDVHRNPYITVDWMPIDLTTFNGEQAFDAAKPDPDDNGNPADTHFASRQRGGSDPANNNAQTFNLWAPVQSGDTLPKSTAGGDGNFKYGLQHTLTYLNQAFPPLTPPPSPAYLGDPQKPFPWITWNARPYANLMELLLVPASSPDRLMLEFSSPGSTANPQPPGTYSPYGYNGIAGPQDFRYPFRHLLNFLHSTDKDYAAGKSANFYRVLDYLTVPSRFVGTQTLLNPNYFKAGDQNFPAFQPPFNYVSNYRDPGLVNINTTTSSDVWNAVMNNVGMTNAGQYFGPDYKLWADSRRGDIPIGSQPSGSLVTHDTNVPTSFAKPLRAAAAADLVPLPTMIQPGVNATLLRPDNSGKAPLFSSTANMDYNNAGRNAYFAYQPLERISNLVTPRSNVFAVWITIGYFEVLPWPQKGINPPNPTAADIAAHADGYQLGAELGSDTGDIVRHRAFYIIDRSIPVGYERGQNHNVNRAVLLRRYIE